MSVVILELPDKLLENLKEQAQKESMSVEQLIVFSLTRHATPTYSISKATPEEIHEQETRFAALRQSLGQASIEEARRVLAEREDVQPESDLDSRAVKTLRSKMKT